MADRKTRHLVPSLKGRRRSLSRTFLPAMLDCIDSFLPPCMPGLFCWTDTSHGLCWCLCQAVTLRVPLPAVAVSLLPALGRAFPVPGLLFCYLVHASIFHFYFSSSFYILHCLGLPAGVSSSILPTFYPYLCFGLLRYLCAWARRAVLWAGDVAITCGTTVCGLVQWPAWLHETCRWVLFARKVGQAADRSATADRASRRRCWANLLPRAWRHRRSGSGCPEQPSCALPGWLLHLGVFSPRYRFCNERGNLYAGTDFAAAGGCSELYSAGGVHILGFPSAACKTLLRAARP